MKFGFDTKTVSIVGAAAFAALTLAAAPAMAEPAPPPPPVPAPLPAAPMAPLAAEISAQPLASDDAAPVADGVPHLLSPENPPPGTSAVRVAPPQPRLTYLRELWHAMQTQEVSGGDALLLLTQRPMVADARPPAGMPAGPQAPLPPAVLPPAPVDAPPVTP